MKKVLGTMLVVMSLMACGGNKEKESAKADDVNGSTSVAASTNSLAGNPDYQKGLALVGKSDCLTCHKVDEKNIGPAYREVAAKYENTEENVKMLAGKIIKGGSGVWGAIPMTPHPTLSQEDAEALAKYVLLLKK
jgi:cytochrome c